MRDEKQIIIIPLKCFNCTTDLKALEEDVVLFCPTCQTCWELKGESLLERKLLVVGKEKRADQSFYLPFWYISRLVLIPAFLSTDMVKMAKYFSQLEMKSSNESIKSLFGASLFSWEAARLISLINRLWKDPKQTTFEIAAIPFFYDGDKIVELVNGRGFFLENIDNFQEIYRRSTEEY